MSQRPTVPPALNLYTWADSVLQAVAPAWANTQENPFAKSSDEGTLWVGKSNALLSAGCPVDGTERVYDLSGIGQIAHLRLQTEHVLVMGWCGDQHKCKQYRGCTTARGYDFMESGMCLGLPDDVPRATHALDGFEASLHLLDVRQNLLQLIVSLQGLKNLSCSGNFHLPAVIISAMRSSVSSACTNKGFRKGETTQRISNSMKSLKQKSRSLKQTSPKFSFQLASFVLRLMKRKRKNKKRAKQDILFGRPGSTQKLVQEVEREI